MVISDFSTKTLHVFLFTQKREEGINKLNYTHITKKFGMINQTAPPPPLADKKVWPPLAAVAKLNYNIKRI